MGLLCLKGDTAVGKNSPKPPTLQPCASDAGSKSVMFLNSSRCHHQCFYMFYFLKIIFKNCLRPFQRALFTTAGLYHCSSLRQKLEVYFSAFTNSKVMICSPTARQVILRTLNGGDWKESPDLLLSGIEVGINR